MKIIKVILTVLLVAAIAGLGIATLSSCNAEVNQDRAAAARLQAEADLARAEAAAVRAQAEAEAQRERAEAERMRIEAEAYQRRQEAETSAAAERSAIRQAERSAAHERTLELLPFTLLVVGVVALGGLAVLALAGRLQRRTEIDPSLVFLLQQQNQRLLEIQRATWHVIAAEQRRQLVAHPGPIVIYDSKGKEVVE